MPRGGTHCAIVKILMEIGRQWQNERTIRKKMKRSLNHASRYIFRGKAWYNGFWIGGGVAEGWKPLRHCQNINGKRKTMAEWFLD